MNIPDDIQMDPSGSFWFSPSTNQYFDLDLNPVGGPSTPAPSQGSSGVAGPGQTGDPLSGPVPGNYGGYTTPDGGPQSSFDSSADAYLPTKIVQSKDGHTLLVTNSGKVLQDYGVDPNGAAQLAKIQAETAKLQAGAALGGSQASVQAEAIRARQAQQQADNSLAELKRQFDAGQITPTAYQQGQLQIQQGQLANQNQQTTNQNNQFNSGQALKYYEDLASNAANPRNFVQSFFQQRGQVAPAAAQGQGNVDAIQRFLPFLLGGAQGSGAVTPSSTASAPRATLNLGPANPGADGGISYMGGSSDFDERTGTYRSTGTKFPPGQNGGGGQNGGPQSAAPGYTADTARLERSNPALAQMLGGGTPTGQNNAVSSTPWSTMSNDTGWRPSAGSDTGATGVQNFVSSGPEAGLQLPDNVPAQQAAENAQNAYNSQQEWQQYAKGGVMHEPIVGRGLVTGQKYSFNEKGPEAVVPTSYLPKFLQSKTGKQVMGGKAYYEGGDLGYGSGDGGGSSYYPDYYMPSLGDPLSGQYGAPVDSGSYAPPTAQSAPDTSIGNDPYNVAAGGTPFSGFAGGVDLVNQTNQSQPTGGPGQSGDPLSGPQSSPYDPNPGSAPSAPAPVFSQPTTQPIAAPSQPITAPAAGTVGLNLGPANPGGQAAPPVDPRSLIPQFVSQPVSQPQGGPIPQTSFGGVTPAQVSPAGTFNGQSQSQPLPTYLPGEDTGGTLAALRASNAVPPFLTRLFAQANGDASQGTNTPNTTALPKDVPVVSQLAYNQMNPSEQQALLSYVSSYGITPDDYLNYIKMLSPTGGSSQSPLFGNRFAFSSNQA